MKKGTILIIFLILAIISPLFASALSLDIKSDSINNAVIKELPDPATFNFTIINLGDKDNIEIYSLVSVDISPRGTFMISAGETKNFVVGVFPSDDFKRKVGYVTFTYKVFGQTGTQEDTLTINLVNFKDAIEIGTSNINLDSNETTIYVQNKVQKDFPQMSVMFSSAFFDDINEVFTLPAFGRKEFTVSLNKEKMAKLVAGQYILSGQASLEKFKGDLEGSINFVEKSGLITTEKTEGIIFVDKTIERKNEGNTGVVAEVSMKKDIISRLFTSFNIQPTKADRKGLSVTYVWSKDLRPAESLIVIAKTNYLYPLLIVLAIVFGAYLIYVYKSSFLTLRKRVSFVRTKGGEFALKITLIASSRKFVEKVSVIDRLPAITKLFERYGATSPDKIDERNRRLEWNIEHLQPGEERVFSYIIYSKVGVVGKFELPQATAVYERDGKLYEVESNKAYFINEAMKKSEDY